MADLSEHEAEIFSLLSNGWVAVHTIKREFRINNGPPEDMAIIEQLISAGVVTKSSELACRRSKPREWSKVLSHLGD